MPMILFLHDPTNLLILMHIGVRAVARILLLGGGGGLNGSLGGGASLKNFKILNIGLRIGPPIRQKALMPM